MCFFLHKLSFSSVLGTISSWTPTTLIRDYFIFDILHRAKVSLSASSVAAANAACRNIDTCNENCILLHLLILEDFHIKLLTLRTILFVFMAHFTFFFSYFLLFVSTILYCQSLPINAYFKGKAIPLQAWTGP
jgi:hypothetical protein